MEKWKNGLYIFCISFLGAAIIGPDSKTKVKAKAKRDEIGTEEVNRI